MTIDAQKLKTLARRGSRGMLGASARNGVAGTPPEKQDGPTYVRAELLAEHAELELLVHTLTEAVAAGDSKALVEPWRKFEEGLATHLATEEAELFPSFSRYAPEETRSFERAHGHLRKLADDLALRVELHIVRAEQIADLLAALRAHRMAEEGAFYRWAEGRTRVQGNASGQR